MSHKRKVYDILNVAVSARNNLERGNFYNAEWASKWDDLIRHIEKNYLPYGSGFDSGTEVNEDECVCGLRLVLTFGYHHMDEHGYYDGWTSHKAIVIPYFDGIGVKVKGALPKKYRHSREYFGDTIHNALTNTISQEEIDEILGVVRPA